ncbi:MAG TPA: ATPase domain-containing protein, partial [Candidatus Binatia bacterium]|nr:ATPase domain-containing protein [Candidatus Binatia bacterium]
TGKSSMAAHFVQAACERGERALYMASEQSMSEVIRNMRSIGVDLEPWVKKGLLQFYASRPGTFGLEKHLVTIHDLTMTFNPRVVVIDPITNFASIGTESEVKSMVTRLIDVFKSRHITAMFTSLTTGDSAAESSEVGVSSQMDVWLLLRNLEVNGERNRGLYVLKARAMAHSNQIREFVLTDHGVQLVDVYVGPSGLLTGSARIAQDLREKVEAAARKQQLQRKQLQLKQKRLQLESQIERLRADFEIEERSMLRDVDDIELLEKDASLAQTAMGQSRQADLTPAQGNGHA